jgi:hypothetical protein
MEKISSVLKSGRGLGEKAWSLVPSKSVLSGLALAAVSGAALFAIGQRIYVNVRTKRIVQKDAEPKHLFVLVPGYLGSPSQMQYVPPNYPLLLCLRAFFASAFCSSPLLAFKNQRAFAVLHFIHFVPSDTLPLVSASATNALR